MNKLPPKLSLLIRRKDTVIFEGLVNAVSSINDIGPFDILPYHANFVCMATKNVKIYLDGGLTKEIEIPKGVMYVKDNRVELYVGV
jgi:F0F1-type ATP synthase epsilon subunit